MDTIAQTGTAPDALSAAPDFLTGYIAEEEYAHQRGVTVRTCQRDRQLRKSPPYIQFGRRVYYRIDAVREWLMKNERAADAKRRSAIRSLPRNQVGGRS